MSATASGAAESDQQASVTTTTIGLRGGFDSNPTDAPNARGSAFETQFVTLDYAHGTAKDGFGVNLASSTTFYDPKVADPALANAATFTNKLDLGSGFTLRSTIKASDDESWSRRQETALLRNRVDYDAQSFRLFLSADAAITSLNERNIFAQGGFLSTPEKFATLSMLPGAAYKSVLGEIGVSLGLTHVDYLEPADYLGLRRDQERIQPNLFVSTTLRGIAIEGSLSPFRAIFPSKDFSGVDKLLYTASVKAPWRMLTLDLQSSRTVQETTLPFTAIDIVTSSEVRLTAKVTQTDAVAGFARLKRDDYRGLGAVAVTRMIGLDYAHALGAGLTATATIALRRVAQTGARIPDGLDVQVGLQKQLDFNKAAAKPP